MKIRYLSMLALALSCISLTCIGRAAAQIQFNPGDEPKDAELAPIEAHIADKRYDEALHDLDALLALHPKSSVAYSDRCLVKIRLKRASDALADCENAIELNRQNTSALRMAADLYYDDGQYTKSITYYDAAIKVRPDDGGLWWLRCDNRRFLKDFSGALSDCNQGVRLLPDAYETWFARGRLFVEMSRYNDAISNLTHSLIIRKTINALYWRGYAHNALKEWPAALQDFTAAIDAGDKSGVVYRDRGFVYDAMHDRKAAAADFRTALHLYRASDEALEADILQQLMAKLGY